MQIEKTAFISYRRTNIYMARSVYQNLTAHGYDCFLDFESIDSGSFERIILNQIAARAHFIVLLTPNTLERCTNPNDWLRREIEHALEMKRNIVPLMFDRFDFGDVQQYLTGKLAALPQYNALEIPPAFFDEAMDRIRNRFLNKPLEMTLHPTPKSDEAAVQRAKANEAAQPTVQVEQRNAEQWYERGLRRDENDYAGKIADYTEAIHLNPQYAIAYNNRGLARYNIGDLNGAIADYNEAIRLDPKLAETYNRWGLARYNQKDWEGAIADYTEAIRLNPQYAIAFNRRGVAYYTKGDLDRAISDYTEAIRLNPQDADIYRNRGVAYRNKGDLWRANADYQRYVDLGGSDTEKVRGWMRDNEKKLRGG